MELVSHEQQPGKKDDQKESPEARRARLDAQTKGSEKLNADRAASDQASAAQVHSIKQGIDAFPSQNRIPNPIRDVKFDRRPSGKLETTEEIFKEIDKEFKNDDDKEAEKRAAMAKRREHATNVHMLTREELLSTAMISSELDRELGQEGFVVPPDPSSAEGRRKIAKDAITEQLKHGLN